MAHLDAVAPRLHIDAVAPRLQQSPALMPLIAEADVACGCDCGAYVAEEGQGQGEGEGENQGDLWSCCDCKCCGILGQGCTVPCSEMLRIETARQRGKDCSILMQIMSTELDLQHLAKENPKFCRDCWDHGLLKLRLEAVQRMRSRKRQRSPGNGEDQPMAKGMDNAAAAAADTAPFRGVVPGAGGVVPGAGGVGHDARDDSPSKYRKEHPHFDPPVAANAATAASRRKDLQDLKDYKQSLQSEVNNLKAQLQVALREDQVRGRTTLVDILRERATLMDILETMREAPLSTWVPALQLSKLESSFKIILKFKLNINQVAMSNV